VPTSHGTLRLQHQFLCESKAPTTAPYTTLTQAGGVDVLWSSNRKELSGIRLVANNYWAAQRTRESWPKRGAYWCSLANRLPFSA